MHTQSSKLRRWSLFVTTLATAAFLLQGCGGGDDGAQGPAGPAGAAGATGATGAPGKDITAKVNVAKLTAEEFGDTKFSATITGVTIASPPVVTFKVTDANGNPVAGLGSTAKSSTATVASYPNFAFSLAKLVPGTNGSPSKWVSYIVTTVPTTTAAATATRPSTDNTGTLVDNGDGTYKYTFYRDITKIKDQVAGFTLTGANVAADLGDLTYDATLTHRLGMQISGVAPGTGTNTSNAVQAIKSVPLKNPINVFYDFIPATGKTVTATDSQREIVKISACFECHSQFRGFHNTSDVAGSPASRQDTRMCVLCHTEQRKFGRTEAVISGNTFTEASQSRFRDFSLTNFPNFVHKIHMGEELTLKGYVVAGISLNKVLYPQPITNCVKCHSASTATPQGDNWKNVPSRLACGACHDGINFATGQGVTLGGDTIGHIGGAKADDKLCILCHDSTTIPTYHMTVDPTGSNGRAGYPANTADHVPTVGFASGQGPSIPLASQLGNLPTGVYKINFELSKVTLASGTGANARKVTVIYRILKDGQPVTVNATGDLITGVGGSPDIQVTYGLPQDGITTPVDWTTSAAVKIIDIRDKKNGHAQTGPDANGWYTAILGTVIPDAAKMITGVIGIDYQGFVQLNLPAYPKGIRLREPKFVMMTASGETARRTVVDADKCNSCHGQLGVKPSFHGGRSNNGAGCALCHTPNNSTSHTGPATLSSPDQQWGGAWSVSAKNLIHGIHGSSKREQPYTYEATAANPLGLGEVEYPGVLRNCEQCHVSGSYDFRNATNAAAVPNLLWTTEAKTNMTNDATTNPTSLPSRGLSPWVTSLGRGQVDYRTDNLVSSPISSACFGCHDSKTALAHMQGNGGTLYASVSTVSTGGARPATGTNTSFSFTKVEACLVCHGSGKVADIKTVHINY